MKLQMFLLLILSIAPSIKSSNSPDQMVTVSGSTVIKDDSVFWGRVKRWWVGGPAYKREIMTSDLLDLAKKNNALSSKKMNLENKIAKQTESIDLIELKIKNLTDQEKAIMLLIAAGGNAKFGQWKGKSIEKLNKIKFEFDQDLSKLNIKLSKQLNTLHELEIKETQISKQIESLTNNIKTGAQMLREADPNALATAAQNAQSLMMGGMASGDGVGVMPIVSMPPIQNYQQQPQPYQPTSRTQTR